MFALWKRYIVYCLLHGNAPLSNVCFIETLHCLIIALWKRSIV